MALGCAAYSTAQASTYVVYLPLDSPVYDELDTLNGLGLLRSYISEIRPISRIEAARLTLEAERTVEDSTTPDQLAESLVTALRCELASEVGWLEQGREDALPTMVQPVERVELQYIFSRGERRQMNGSLDADGQLQAREATPLVPNDDDLPTEPGSNEVARWSGWAGAGSFLTMYGEGSLAGPITRNPAGLNDSDTSRARLLRGQVVVSLGNLAASWGAEEMAWGTGHFASLSQGSNARPFYALSLQNIHPTLLPGFLRYLGAFRSKVFFGQLDHGRVFSRPWISGQILAFKPLPVFEFGFTHVIMFGGSFNDQYGVGGFLGRATGLSTGNPEGADTNARGGVFLKLYFPKLREIELYQEILGEDNLTAEVSPIGRFLPFLAVSYQGGIYIPRLTRDGLTSARFEYAILEPNYSIHGDSLYWTYYDRLMGDPIGPDGTEVDLEFDRWISLRYRIGLDLFYTERAPKFGVPELTKEHSGGLAATLFTLPDPLRRFGMGALGEIRVRTAFEYVNHINFEPSNNSFRIGIVLGGSLEFPDLTWTWH